MPNELLQRISLGDGASPAALAIKAVGELELAAGIECHGMPSSSRRLR
jgi:hypothetical protein